MNSFIVLATIAGGSWMAQILLERNAKDGDAEIAKAVGYGAIGAIGVKFLLASLQVGRLFGVW